MNLVSLRAGVRSGSGTGFPRTGGRRPLPAGLGGAAPAWVTLLKLAVAAAAGGLVAFFAVAWLSLPSVRAPDPVLGPEAVVRIQVQALGQLDGPLAAEAARIVFRFASPRNLLFTGPYSRFVEMLGNPFHFPMVRHRGAQLGPLEQNGDQAWQVVLYTTPRGGQVAYQFRLSRQTSGPCAGCWLTDSVWPMQRRGPSPPGRGGVQI